MKYLVLISIFLVSGCTTQYALEKEKYKAGQTCSEMEGIWFTDVIVDNLRDGRKRDITRLERSADGSAYLKGISVYYDTNEITDWEFSSTWSCDRDWYVESNEWGFTSFKIVSLNKNKNVLLDKRNNLNAPTPIELVETRKLKVKDSLTSNPKVREFLGL